MPKYNTTPPQLRNNNNGKPKIDFNKVRARNAIRSTNNNAPIVWPQSEPEQNKQGFMSRLNDLIANPNKGLAKAAGDYGMSVVGDYKAGGQDIINSVESAGRGEQSPLSAGLQTAGTVAKTAFSPINRLLEPLINKAADVLANDGTFQKVANTDFVGERLADISFGMDSYSDWAKRNPELSGNIEAGTNIGLLLAGEKPTQKALQLGSDAVAGGINKGLRAKAAITDTAGALRDGAPDLITKGKELFKPSKDTKGIVGEITQAKNTRDLAQAEKALTEIDTTDITTYEQLLTKVKADVKTNAGLVDEALGKDTNIYKPKDLTVTAKTEGGKTVKTDYVSRALQHLEEIYTSVGDDLSAANIREAITKYVKQGFTRVDVNDLARVYGKDAPKAFSKLGDALTSKTAQASEAIRSGLKDVARQGMDDTAQLLDAKITNLKTLEGYTLKMQEAVQNLTNKVEERGLLEKAGRALGQVADITTGGFAKSFFNKFLIPSNVGNKILNSLDLQAKLASNLKLLQKAATETSDAGMLKTIQQIVKEQTPSEVKQVTPVQFEQRSSIERSPIIKYIKDNPPNLGLSIRDVKTIDSLTKKEMIDIIDYARLNKDYNQSLEDAIGYLAEKYNLRGKNLKDIADELEVLVRDTKTSAEKAPKKVVKPVKKTK